MSQLGSSRLPEGVLAFAVVGAIGFGVDAVILNSLIFNLEWGYYTARIASFGVAVLVTWVLNRNWTFRKRATSNKKKESSAYFLVQTLGALINFAFYSACIWIGEPFITYPVLALAVGSAIAMCFNFIALRKFAFTGSRGESR